MTSTVLWESHTKVINERKQFENVLKAYSSSGTGYCFVLASSDMKVSQKLVLKVN